MLNQDSRLIAKIADNSNIRPNQQNLTSEILQKRRLITTFANTAPPDYPITGADTYHYLGMTINRSNDTMSVRAKPLLLKSRKQGQQDIIIRNMEELNTYLTTCKFTRAHLVSLMAGLYCPPAHLNAIFTAVAINPKFHPLVLKLATLYFKNQYLTIPRCCTAFTPLSQTSYWLVGFTDGSLEYSTACIYLISA